MKIFRYFKINISALLLLLAIVSCEEQLSTDPVDRIIPQTVEDYEAVLVGGLPGVYHAFTDLMTDDVVAKNYTSFNDPQIYAEWSLPYIWIDQRSSDESSTPEYAWRWYYADIYKVNLVIANVMEAEGDKEWAASLLGEALVTRAYSHFNLVNLFSKHYDPVTAATDLGVPLALEPMEAGFHSFKRNTVQEVYDQIEADLLQGLELINDDFIEKPLYHFSELATLAFASRFYLFKGEYEKSLEYSNAVLAINNRLVDHNDFPISDLAETFEPLEHADNYFTDESENIIMLRSGFFAVNYYKSGFYANEFKNIYDSRDLRGSQNFTFTNPYKPNYITLKLSLSFEQYNYPLFRTEEMVLNKAEALARLGGDDNKTEVIRTLNILREKRYQDGYYVPLVFRDFGTQEQLIAEVMLERRKEFCYEGFRWYDLKRTGYPEIVHNLNGKDYVLEENDLRYVLQIPDDELINNPLMEKNPR